MASIDIAPAVVWDTFFSNFVWKQGQHVILIGPNGSGKTVLNKHLLRYRMARHGYICVFVTKPVDSELSGLEKEGFLRVKNNTNWNETSHPRILLWPAAGEFTSLGPQRKAFLSALQGMWKAGKWTACLNELRYLYEHLRLKLEMNTLYLQARASKVSITGETQRPRMVPLEAINQSAHMFFAGCRDDEDLKRIGGLGNAPTRLVRDTVQALKQYEFCYVNAITGDVVRTKARPYLMAGEKSA